MLGAATWPTAITILPMTHCRPVNLILRYSANKEILVKQAKTKYLLSSFLCVYNNGVFTHQDSPQISAASPAGGLGVSDHKHCTFILLILAVDSLLKHKGQTWMILLRYSGRFWESWYW